MQPKCEHAKPAHTSKAVHRCTMCGHVLCVCRVGVEEIGGPKVSTAHIEWSLAQVTCPRALFWRADGLWGPQGHSMPPTCAGSAGDGQFTGGGGVQAGALPDSELCENPFTGEEVDPFAEEQYGFDD